MKNIKIIFVLAIFISSSVYASCVDFNSQNGECIQWEDGQQTEVAMNYGNDYDESAVAVEPDYNSDACRERGECY